VISAVARSVLRLARDPTHPRSVVLAQTKSSLGPIAPSLRLRLTGTAMVFEGVGPLSAEALARSRGPQIMDAVLVLERLLGEGAVPVKLLQQMIAEAGVSWQDARDAKEVLGIELFSVGDFPPVWYWRTSGDARLAPSGIFGTDAASDRGDVVEYRPGNAPDAFDAPPSPPPQRATRPRRPAPAPPPTARTSAPAAPAVSAPTPEPVDRMAMIELV
jgi:hypothetical protein